MKRKIMSLVIILSMILGFIPGLQPKAYAADEPTVLEDVYEDKTDEEKITDAIEALRSYYSSKDFTFRVALAYNFTSDNLERDSQIIQQRLKMNEESASPSDYSGIIIGLIAAGKNPRNYNGKNYVQLLIQSLDDQNWAAYPTSIAWGILALDMAKAEYDVEKAVDALLSYQIDNGGFDGGWGDSVDDTAMCIMALAKHKDIKGAKDAIAKAKKYIKDKQEDNGGFVSWGAENPYSAAAAIQGLIAIGEDPLSEEWTTESGKTILDALLEFMIDDHFEYVSEWGTDIDSITEQAFCALADLYRGKSMFHEIVMKDVEPHEVRIQQPPYTTIKENGKLKLRANVYNPDGEIILGHSLLWESSYPAVAEIDSEGLVTAKSAGKVTITVTVEGHDSIKDTIELTVEPEEFKVTRIDTGKIKNGSEARLEFNIRENMEQTRSATLIVALYDKNTNKMINYAFATKEYQPGESTNLGAGFLVPETGNHIIKCFVWEDLENQNVILANPIDIDVEK
ncbi:MAG: Ig-like domain-containing protein [Tepidanaerobacteraceae bacterium]